MLGVLPAVVMVTAETPLSIVAVVEQQPHHHLVLQAVHQRCGKHRVVHRREVTVHVCLRRQQQLHDLVAPRPDRHQEAAQRVQVGFGSRLQQHLSAGGVPVGDSKVQRASPHVSVVF